MQPAALAVINSFWFGTSRFRRECTRAANNIDLGKTPKCVSACRWNKLQEFRANLLGTWEKESTWRKKLSNYWHTHDLGISDSPRSDLADTLTNPWIVYTRSCLTITKTTIYKLLNITPSPVVDAATTEAVLYFRENVGLIFGKRTETINSGRNTAVAPS